MSNLVKVHSTSRGVLGTEYLVTKCNKDGSMKGVDEGVDDTKYDSKFRMTGHFEGAKHYFFYAMYMCASDCKLTSSEESVRNQ